MSKLIFNVPKLSEAKDLASLARELEKTLKDYAYKLNRLQQADAGEKASLDRQVTEVKNVTNVTEVSGAASGNMTGPSSAVADNFVGFSGTSGIITKDSGSKASDFVTGSGTASQWVRLTGAKVIASQAGKILTTVGTPAAATLFVAASSGGAVTSELRTVALTFTAADRKHHRGRNGTDIAPA